MRSLRRFMAVRTLLLALCLAVASLTVVTPTTAAVAGPQTTAAAAVNYTATLPIQFTTKIPPPMIEWWIIGGHLYNSSSSRWTYYTRDATGRYRQLPNGLLYSVGWHSQPYKVYPVGPGDHSAFLHDADMMWVPAGVNARVRMLDGHGRGTMWRTAPGGSFGAWYKLKPQFIKWEIWMP